MNSFKSTTKLLLLLILTIGFLLRVNNLTIGFPMLYLSNDEAVYHLSALNIIANKTPFTLGNYGPLGSYIQIPFLFLSFLTLKVGGVVNSIWDMELLLVTQDGYLMFIPRILSALFGTLTIIAIYKLSLRILAIKRAALWSAFFAAVSFDLVHISHFARALSPAIFFATLSALFAINTTLSSRDELKNRFLSFTFAAIAFGFHQVVGIIIVLPLIFSLKKTSSRTFSRNLLISLMMWILMITVFNYLSLRNNFLQVFKSNNTLQIELIRTPAFWLSKDVSQIVSTVFQNLKMFWSLFLAEGIIIVFSFYGLFIEKIKNKIRISYIVFFSFCLLLSLFIFPPVLRYLLPVIVFLPVFAGIGAHRLIAGKNILIILIVLSLASFNSIYWNYLITKTPTFVQMRNWLDLQIPPETPIYATYYRAVGYVPSKEASMPIRKYRPEYYARASSLLIDNKYPYNVRNILYLEGFNKGSKVENLNAGMQVYPTEYIIDAYYSQRDRLLLMEKNLILLAHFTPTNGYVSQKRIPELFADVANNFPLFILERSGPYIDILKIQK